MLLVWLALFVGSLALLVLVQYRGPGLACFKHKRLVGRASILSLFVIWFIQITLPTPRAVLTTQRKLVLAFERKWDPMLEYKSVGRLRSKCGGMHGGLLLLTTDAPALCRGRTGDFHSFMQWLRSFVA